MKSDFKPFPCPICKKELTMFDEIFEHERLHLVKQ